MSLRVEQAIQKHAAKKLGLVVKFTSDPVESKLPNTPSFQIATPQLLMNDRVSEYSHADGTFVATLTTQRYSQRSLLDQSWQSIKLLTCIEDIFYHKQLIWSFDSIFDHSSRVFIRLQAATKYYQRVTKSKVVLALQLLPKAIRMRLSQCQTFVQAVVKVSESANSKQNRSSRLTVISILDLETTFKSIKGKN